MKNWILWSLKSIFLNLRTPKEFSRFLSRFLKVFKSNLVILLLVYKVLRAMRFQFACSQGKKSIWQTGCSWFFPAAPKTFPATYGRLKLFLAPAAPKTFPAAYGRLRFFLAPAAPEIFPAGGTPKNGPIFFPGLMGLSIYVSLGTIFDMILKKE